MGPMPECESMLVWLAPEQGDMVAGVLDRLGVRAAGVGGTVRGRSGGIARTLGAPVVEDLRAALAGEPYDVVWIACAGDFGRDANASDVSAILEARSRGVRILASEPLPASALDLHAGAWLRARHGVSAAACVRFVPLARGGTGFVALREVLGSFGRVHSISMEFASRGDEASLGAHLFSALELIAELLGEAESVDAAYHMPAPAGALRLLPGETLADLHGTISAHLRFGDGRGISLLASDRGAYWTRGVTIIGDGGQIRACDDSLEWVDPTGEIVESSSVPPGEVPSVRDAGEREIARAIRGILEDHPSEARPAEIAPALAMGQAALLSVRTGQSESPGTIRRMTRAG